MNFKFEKTHADINTDVSEKNQQELGGLKISPEGKLTDRNPEEEPEIQTAKDFIDFLDAEIKKGSRGELSREEKKALLHNLENVEEFKESFENKLLGKSEKEALREINLAMKDFSHMYDSLTDVYNTTLDQRLGYRDVADAELNTTIKEQLENRIQDAQKFQKKALELEEFLESKRIEYILKSETFKEEQDEE